MKIVSISIQLLWQTLPKLACILALGAVVALSSCGVLKRFGNRTPEVVDSSIAGIAIPDTRVIDSPELIGPIMDSGMVVTSPKIPELADDSGMAMPFWMVPLSYTTFSGKAKAHIESPEESRDFTLTVRIESGKKIWISVVGSALGISMEAFRAVLTPDSMIAINRIDREVIRAPFSEIANLFPVKGDFSMLEAVLAGAKLPVVQRFSGPVADPISGAVMISGTADSSVQSIFFSGQDSSMIRQTLQQPNSTTDLLYSKYSPGLDRRFAQVRQIKLRSAGFEQTLDLDFTSFSFDEPVDMTINIPDKYKQR